jgi:alpha-galactosidase
MLEVGNGGMTATQYRTHMSLWALLAAPLLAGNDLRSASAETLAILTHPEVIAIDQDSLGRQGARSSASGAAEIWAKPLAGGRLAAEIGVLWKDLGIAGKAAVRDVWSRTDLGARADGYSVKVPAHGVALLVVTTAAQGAAGASNPALGAAGASTPTPPPAPASPQASS